jgi:magnesium chelatase accessory protein
MTISSDKNNSLCAGKGSRLKITTFLKSTAQALEWSSHGHEWPHCDSSRFIKVGNLTWHVQIMGRGPVLLLAHGMGASSHSWRDLMPGLARHFTVVAPDLPGHGFTGSPVVTGMTLNGMAAGLRALLQVLGVSPAVVAGHSAGAAILTRLALDETIAPAVVVALNGAMLPFPAVPGTIFRTVARMLALTSVVSRLASWRASRPGMVEKMIANTGSTLTATGIGYYARLMRSPLHIRNVLRMMSNWDLRQFALDLPYLPCRLVLVAADGDIAVPPKVARETAALVPDCEVIRHGGYGHLSHEEAPDETVALIVRAAREAGVPVDREDVREVPAQQIHVVGQPVDAAE